MKILKVLLLSRILQFFERWKNRKWQIFDIFRRSITVGMKDVFMWFGHWIKLGNFGSQFLTEIYTALYLFLEMWKFQNVGYALRFYSSLSNKNMQKANVWNFNSMHNYFIQTSSILNESNFQTFTISLFFITQCAVKFWIIAKPIYFSYP